MIAMNDAFSISHIDDAIFKRINGRSYKKNCPLPLTELRYLRLLHKNLSGEVLSGEMICNRAIADALIDIFSRLFDASYPIERMILIDDYDADDELSMRDNNSSCFNFRFVSHTNRISKHGYGLAVDINPLYNPYITFVDGKKNIEPATAVAFAPIFLIRSSRAISAVGCSPNTASVGAAIGPIAKTGSIFLFWEVDQ